MLIGVRRAVIVKYDPAPGVSISTYSHDYPRASDVREHAHGSHQLVYASHGVMEVKSRRHLWVLPPHFGLWVPAETPHQIRMPEAVSMRTLYIRRTVAALGNSCQVLHISPFLRELIFEIVRVGRLRVKNKLENSLREVLVSQLGAASSLPSGVAMPVDPRALAVAQSTLADPASRRCIQELCISAGIGIRTLQRVFRKEVGMDFESWRRQVRLMKSIELLVAGRSVKEVAYAVGYREPGPFVALFRAAFGVTPKAWVLSYEQPGRRISGE
jgi:AraC-like DNA-binding protein